MRQLVLVFLLGGVGCGDDDFVPPADAGRSDVPIPADSGQDAPPVLADVGPGGCSVRDEGGAISDSCGGVSICVCPPGEFLCNGTGRCEDAYTRGYRIGVASVSLPPRAPDGTCWDEPGCGAPDPYAVITVDEAEFIRAEPATDIFEGTYDPPLIADVVLFEGSRIRIDVFDSDVVEDDGALACVVESVDAALLRSRDLSCAGALGSIVAVLTPQ